MPLPYTREELRQAVHAGRRRQRPRRLLHPADRLPRLRQDGPLPAGGARQRGRRRLAVGRLPRRGGPAHRRPRQGLELAAHRPEHHPGHGQGRRPVPQLDPRQDRGPQGRLRGGHPAERRRLRGRRLGREPLHRARRRPHHPAGPRLVLEGITRASDHHPRRATRASRCSSARSPAATSTSPTRCSSPAPPPRSARSSRSTTARSAPRARSRARLQDRFFAATDGPRPALGRVARLRRGRRAGARRRAPAPRDRARPHLRHHPARRDAARGPLSLSVGEQLAVARAPRRVRRRLHRGRLPGEQPQVRRAVPGCSSARTWAPTRLAAFGMTRRRGTAAEDDPAIRGPGRELRARSSRSSARPGTSTSRRSPGSRREENLRDDRGLGRLPRRRRARRSSTTPSTSSTATTPNPEYALRLPAGGRGGRGRLDRPATPTAARCPTRSPRSCARCARPCRGVGARHPHPRRRRVRRGQRLAARRGGRPPGAGHDQRLRRALRQRQPHHDHPEPHAEDGLRDARRRAPRASSPPLSNYVAEMANLPARPRAPYVGTDAFAHKAGMHAQGMNADARSLRAHRPGARRQRAPGAGVRAGGPRRRSLAKARELGLDLDEDPQRVPGDLDRLKDLEHEGYHFEVADGSFELLIERATGVYEPLFTLESFRVITEKRADGRVETEATVKVFHRRRAPRGHGRGQRPRQRARRRAAPGARARGCPSCATSTWSTSRCASSTRPRAPAPSPGC